MKRLRRYKMQIQYPKERYEEVRKNIDFLSITHL